MHKLINIVQSYLKFSISVFHSSLGPKSLLKSSIINTSSGNYCQTVSILEEEYVCNHSLSKAIKLGVLSKFKLIKLIPIPFSQLIGDIGRGNKLGGWHFGGTLVMSDKPSLPTECYPNGELKGMNNLFVVDSASFPSIPGSSVALLTMANAYRIAKGSLPG